MGCRIITLGSFLKQVRHISVKDDLEIFDVISEQRVRLDVLLKSVPLYSPIPL